MISIYKIVLVLLFSCLLGIQVLAQPVSDKKKYKKPEQLVIAIADNGTGKRVDAIKPVADYLTQELKITVTATVAPNAVGLLQMLKDRTVDIAYINGFGYVLGISDSLPLVPLVTPGNADGTPNTYNSCIFSAPSSGIKSLADMVVRAQDYSFLFVNPTSTSGHLIPRLYLNKLGLKQVEGDFKHMEFADNHYNTISARLLIPEEGAEKIQLL